MINKLSYWLGSKNSDKQNTERALIPWTSERNQTVRKNKSWETFYVNPLNLDLKDYQPSITLHRMCRLLSTKSDYRQLQDEYDARCRLEESWNCDEEEKNQLCPINYRPRNYDEGVEYEDEENYHCMQAMDYQTLRVSDSSKSWNRNYEHRSKEGLFCGTYDNSSSDSKLNKQYPSHEYSKRVVCKTSSNKVSSVQSEGQRFSKDKKSFSSSQVMTRFEKSNDGNFVQHSDYQHSSYSRSRDKTYRDTKCDSKCGDLDEQKHMVKSAGPESYPLKGHILDNRDRVRDKTASIYERDWEIELQQQRLITKSLGDTYPLTKYGHDRCQEKGYSYDNRYGYGTHNQQNLSGKIYHDTVPSVGHRYDMNSDTSYGKQNPQRHAVKSASDVIPLTEYGGYSSLLAGDCSKKETRNENPNQQKLMFADNVTAKEYGYEREDTHFKDNRARHDSGYINDYAADESDSDEEVLKKDNSQDANLRRRRFSLKGNSPVKLLPQISRLKPPEVYVESFDSGCGGSRIHTPYSGSLCLDNSRSEMDAPKFVNVMSSEGSYDVPDRNIGTRRNGSVDENAKGFDTKYLPMAGQRPYIFPNSQISAQENNKMTNNPRHYLSSTCSNRWSKLSDDVFANSTEDERKTMGFYDYGNSSYKAYYNSQDFASSSSSSQSFDVPYYHGENQYDKGYLQEQQDGLLQKSDKNVPLWQNNKPSMKGTDVKYHGEHGGVSDFSSASKSHLNRNQFSESESNSNVLESSDSIMKPFHCSDVGGNSKAMPVGAIDENSLSLDFMEKLKTRSKKIDTHEWKSRRIYNDKTVDEIKFHISIKRKNLSDCSFNNQESLDLPYNRNAATDDYSHLKLESDNYSNSTNSNTDTSRNSNLSNNDSNFTNDPKTDFYMMQNYYKYKSIEVKQQQRSKYGGSCMDQKVGDNYQEQHSMKEPDNVDSFDDSVSTDKYSDYSQDEYDENGDRVSLKSDGTGSVRPKLCRQSACRYYQTDC